MGILCFSLFGYRMVLDLVEQRQERAISYQIDKGIATEALLSLKVAVGLPYYTNNERFEHIDGDIQIDGVVYRYVKRRIFNDSIEYLCLRHTGKTRLLSARDQFFQMAYDLQSANNSEGNGKQPVKPLQLEYCNPGQSLLSPVAPIVSILSSTRQIIVAQSGFRRTPAEPPERTSTT